jgi:hypothetical protein
VGSEDAIVEMNAHMFHSSLQIGGAKKVPRRRRQRHEMRPTGVEHSQQGGESGTGWLPHHHQQDCHVHGIADEARVRAAGDLEASELPCSTHIPKWELKNPNSSVTMRGVETISSFEKGEVSSVYIPTVFWRKSPKYIGRVIHRTVGIEPPRVNCSPGYLL